MNIQYVIDLILEKSILTKYKTDFKHLDGINQVGIATLLNNNIYSYDFLVNLVTKGIQCFEFRKRSSIPYLIDGHITVSVYLYTQDDKFIIKPLELWEGNKGYEFKTEEELISILTELELLKL